MMTPLLARSFSFRTAALLSAALIPAGLSISRALADGQSPPTKPPATRIIPAEKAGFRSMVPVDEYQQRVALYPPELLDRELIEADKSPEWGAVINGVTPGGPGDRAGITVGWTITRCDEREIWHRRQDVLSDRDREITAVSPKGEEKTFSFPVGKLGMTRINKRKPERAVLREIPAGPWDKDLLTAIYGYDRGDRDLAETAFYLAFSRGMPEKPCTDYYLALIALDRGDNATARTRCDAVLAVVAPGGAEIPRFYREGMRTLAIGLRDMALLKRSNAEMDEVPDMLHQDQVQYWQDHGAEKMKGSLLKEALERAGENVISKIVVPQDGWQKRYEVSNPKVLAGQFGINPAVGLYNGQAFTGPEPMRDLIWEVKGRFGDNGAGPGDRSVNIGLFDSKIRAEYGSRGAWTPEAWRVAFVSMVRTDQGSRTINFQTGLNGGLLETQRDFPRMTEPESLAVNQALQAGQPVPEVPAQRTFDIKFIRIGNEVEIIMNGISYLRLPLRGDVGDLGCEYQFSGCNAFITSCSLRAIGPRKK